MPRPLRATLAAAAIAIISLLSVPLPATADTLYPPSGSCTASPATAGAGETITFGCAAATFSSTEPVTITVRGENGAGATIGMVRLAVTTASGTARSASDGSLAPISITLPGNATGTYNIAAVSPTSAGGTAAATIARPTGGLPTTGLDAGALMGVWIGGGALVLAGVVLVIAAAVRRRRDRS